MQSLFKPGAKINQDHKHKYIHILAYAASVVEMWKKVMFTSVNNIIFYLQQPACAEESVWL